MFRKTLAAIAFTALTIGSAQALTIDDFSTTQLLSDPGVSSGSVVSGSILGGERDASITRLTGADPSTLSFNSGSTGTMSIANGTGGTSSSEIIWDGIGGVGLGGIDLTVGGAQDALDLRIIANDFAAIIDVFVGDTSNNFSLLTQSTSGGIPGPASIPFLFEFASFNPFAGPAADFTNVHLIILAVTTNLNATDIELDFFGTTTTNIPEPATLALLGLGLAGLGFARRRRA